MIQPIPKGFEVGVLLKQLENIVRAIKIPIEAENPSSRHHKMLDFHHNEKSRNETLIAWLRGLEESWFGPYGSVCFKEDRIVKLWTRS
ncbi:unnamed protein product [Trifolium pratense]|uniref:Uncharacterized protein n=1 Tax=Trifolium pratense TaxID=57577 RepID=A0ACB0MFP4_TRIPR|nr:unnamed protein product [Trifolium pratense]